MSFPVKDLARAREFYEGILGLEEIPRPVHFTFPEKVEKRILNPNP